MKAEQVKASKTNGGIGYVTFLSNVDVKKVAHRKDYKKLIMENLTQQERMDTQALQWKVKQAPSYSDIIWENIYKDDGIREVKSWFLVIILFVTCVLLVTPVFLLDNLNKLLVPLTEKLGKNNLLSILIQTYLSPLILLAFNSGIIPFFIDMIGLLEEHKTKSRRQVAIMRKNFFFQLFNLVFLQLSGQATI